MRRWPWIVLVAACGRSPDAAVPPRQVPADDCPAAYDKYEQTWHAALGEDMAALGLSPDAQKSFADKMTDGLPTRDELAKIRETNRLGMGSSHADTPLWLVAYAAAEHAIARCGSGANPTMRGAR